MTFALKDDTIYSCLGAFEAAGLRHFPFTNKDKGLYELLLAYFRRSKWDISQAN